MLVAAFFLGFVVVKTVRVACANGDGNDGCEGLSVAEYILRSVILLVVIVSTNFRRVW